MFRLGGDINLRSTDVAPGNRCKLSVDAHKPKLAFIQCLRPLTPQFPYFSVHITNIKSNGCVTIGIANSDMNDTVSPGCWNNTVGYESVSGKCLSSHRVNANTNGRVVQKGDTFGLVVTSFGAAQSTVVFVYNDEPVATRYYFESDWSRYLATITFANGPIDVEVVWPHAMSTSCLPNFVKENKAVSWIKPPKESCEANDAGDEFESKQRVEDMPVQSALSLCRRTSLYRCVQLEVSGEGQGASVGIASCSPLKPTPTCSLLRDYYTWLPKMKLKYGDSIGWGVFYNVETPAVNDKAEQLVLLYVTFNETIVDVLFVLQPEGGFYPLVLMQPWARKVRLETVQDIGNDYSTKLSKLFNSKVTPALEIYNRDLNDAVIDTKDVTVSGNEVSLTVERNKSVIRIAAHKAGLHYIQYCKPLTPERRYFFVEIVKLGKKSNVVIGVASSGMLEPANRGKLPGQLQDTIGYNSRDGLLSYNGKSHGNMMGHKCSRGDSMGIEMEVFGSGSGGGDQANSSVAIFEKNFKPVGTRFLTLAQADAYLPTIVIGTDGESAEINVFWQTIVSMPPHFNVRNPEDWCCPEGTKIDPADKSFVLPAHFDQSLCLQAPYSLHNKYNHFEVVLADDFDKNKPPPAIALCSASPFDPPPASQFKQDYLRFWPTGDAMSAVRKNDRLGWGIFYADESTPKNEEQLMICFLTINRQVVYLRVLYQPPGGFYPVVIAPPNVNRIKMDFMATRVTTEDFAGSQIRSIIMDANKQIELEKQLLAQGKNPREELDESKTSKTCAII